MRTPNERNVYLRTLLAACLLALLTLVGCSVNVKNGENGENKKVEIETPIGGIHVDNNANARDTGLPVYPGARLKEKEENGEEKRGKVVELKVGTKQNQHIVSIQPTDNGKGSDFALVYVQTRGRKDTI